MRRTLAITIDRPLNPDMVVSRLCRYRLRLYGARTYLATREIPRQLSDLSRFDLIGYVDDLLFSNQLSYLDPLLQALPERPRFTLRSTSVITQMQAVRAGAGLAVLPCFMAEQDPSLVPLLTDDIDICREFWIASRSEQRQLMRVCLLWKFLKDAIDRNRHWLMGEDSGGLQLPEEADTGF